MSYSLSSEVLSVLVAYWQGTPPASIEHRTLCRQLTDRIVKTFSGQQANQIAKQYTQHIEALEKGLEQLVQNDPVAREFCRQLAPQKSLETDAISPSQQHRVRLNATILNQAAQNISGNLDSSQSHQYLLLQRYRYILAHYLEQRAIFGKAFVPAYIPYKIDQARSHIKAIKAELRRQGRDVDDQVNDVE